MSRRSRGRSGPALETLEPRLALSGAPLGTVQPGVVTTPGGVGTTTAVVAPANLSPGRHTTLLGLKALPGKSGLLLPVVAGAAGEAGQALPFRRVSVYRPGLNGSSRAYAKVATPGAVTTAVTGRDATTGSYLAQTTVAGDVNGDGKVDMTDEQLFAAAFNALYFQKNYNPAADFNDNGYVGIEDAKVLLRNLTPLTPKHPISVNFSLAKGQEAPTPHTTVSGGATYFENVTIVGRTTPGALVFSDSGLGDFSFRGKAFVADPNGFFFAPAKNSDGINNNNFLVIDPYGQQTVRAYPIFYIPVANYSKN